MQKNAEKLRNILSNKHEFERLFRTISHGVKWGETDRQFEGIEELAGEILQHPWVVSDLRKFSAKGET